MKLEKLESTARKANWAVAIFFVVLIIISLLSTSCTSRRASIFERAANHIVTQSNVVSMDTDSIVYTVEFWSSDDVELVKFKAERKLIEYRDGFMLVPKTSAIRVKE